MRTYWAVRATRYPAGLSGVQEEHGALGGEEEHGAKGGQGVDQAQQRAGPDTLARRSSFTAPTFWPQ